VSAVVDYQLTSGHADWPRLRDSAQWAEANGFGAIWVVDHIAGRSMGGDQAYESFTWLGAMAASTERIELGSLVTNVWNRSVGTAIVAAATVAEISQRRFWFGIGAGTSPSSSFAWEQNAVGAEIEPSMARRQERVEHLLELSEKMWRTATGEFPTFLKPQHIPWRVVGVNSIRLSAIAATQADGINVAWNHPRRDEFLASCREAKPRPDFQWTTFLPYDTALLDPEHPTRVEMDERGINRVILLESGVPRVA
jgi:alkanesulfonate monooxygenase SsuD/methylene tetrahydromethanopterin reductase-like flavin-dependent oxidoreductase (luciferase family)